jgi:hypothetical protein
METTAVEIVANYCPLLAHNMHITLQKVSSKISESQIAG